MPLRWWPKWKSAPTMTRETSRASIEEALDEILGADLREGAIEGHDDEAVETERFGELRLRVGGVRRNITGCGAKTSRGWGSKVITIAGTPRSAARALRAAKTC